MLAPFVGCPCADCIEQQITESTKAVGVQAMTGPSAPCIVAFENFIRENHAFLLVPFTPTGVAVPP